MKIISNIIRITGTILTALIISYNVSAQGPPPPPGGSSGGSNTSGNQNGGNAPIGGGLLILLGLGAAYGGRKLYQIRKETLEE